MHGGTDGALLEYRGHTLTADELHAFVYGSLGLLAGLNEDVSKAIAREPHYFIGGLVVSYFVGRRLRE